MSQEQLADEIGRGTSSISKLERGIMMPGIDTLVLLANALNCQVDDFVRPDTNSGDSTTPKGDRQILTQEAWAVVASLDDAELKAVIIAARAIASIRTDRSRTI